MSKSVARLFEQFQPEHYRLDIDLDRPGMAFGGKVIISGRKAGRPSKRITLHGHGLKVTSASIAVKDKKGEREIPVSRINLQKSLHEIRLHTDTLLYPGQYTVTIEFNSAITVGMTGLYPCNFKLDGEDHALLATQFESHHAREVFPCIDEPEAKATFDLTLATETGVTVLSNTPVKKQSTEDGKLVTTFETTPRMSSYLLAFVVGILQHKTAKTRTGTDVSIYSTPAHPIESLDFALETSVKVIEFFEEYFGAPYPLAKADHIALPDFSSGAMENWGLITYRERILLAYPGQTSQSIREVIAMVIAHETSHQWFGNLVTMKWWDDLWLNESFANMMEYRALDDLFPDWHMWDTFISQEGLSALRRDATPGVQAVKTEVHHPDEIGTLFDPSIVYAKGGRLLFMLMHYIGEDAFRKGLRSYFKKFAFKNTVGADLWGELSNASGADVAAFMDPWLERPGFPVISVDSNTKGITIRQRHFLDNPDKADESRLWPVPLFADIEGIPTLLDKQHIKLPAGQHDVLRLNRGARGHYIVNYETPAIRTAVGKLVSSGTLTNAERLMLLNDASMLSRAGLRPYGDVLELLAEYKDETNDSVWDMIALIVGESRRFVDLDELLEDKIKQFIRTLTKAEFERLGWDEQDGESVADQKLRALIIGLGAFADEPGIIEEAKRRFGAYRKDPDSLSSEIRSIVLGVPVKLGDTEAIDYLIKLHDETSNSDLKGDVTGALTSTRSDKTAQRLLERIKDPKLVKPQDADRWLAYLLRSRYVRDTAWKFMESEWQWFEGTYKDDKSYDYLPRYAAGACNTPEQAERYRKFFEPKRDQLALRRNIQIGIEEINNRVKWLQRDLGSVQSFFSGE
jgi:aminopeptidase N